MGEIPLVPWNPILLVKTRNLAFPCSQLMVDVSFNKLFEYRNEFGATAGSKADPTAALLYFPALGIHTGELMQGWHGLLVRERASQMGLGLWMKTRVKWGQSCILLLWRAVEAWLALCSDHGQACLQSWRFHRLRISWQGKSSAAHAPVSSAQREQLRTPLHGVHAAP